MGHPYALGKQHKLCSLSAIDALFRNGDGTQGALAFPLRMVWCDSKYRPEGDSGFDRIMVSVPKKRLRHAVDRVKIRRLVREAYRLHCDRSRKDRCPIDIAFIYVANTVLPYPTIEKAVVKLLKNFSCEDDSE